MEQIQADHDLFLQAFESEHRVAGGSGGPAGGTGPGRRGKGGRRRGGLWGAGASGGKHGRGMEGGSGAGGGGGRWGPGGSAGSGAGVREGGERRPGPAGRRVGGCVCVCPRSAMNLVLSSTSHQAFGAAGSLPSSSSPWRLWAVRGEEALSSLASAVRARFRGRTRLRLHCTWFFFVWQ